MVDVVIINPNGRQGYDGLDQLPAIQPPVWAGMLATHFRRKGQEVRIIDANAEHLTDEAVVAQLHAIGAPELWILPMGQNPSASTQVMPATIELALAIARSGRYAHVAGLHPSAMPAYCRSPDTPTLGSLLPKPIPVAWDLLPMHLYRAHNWHALGHKTRKPYGVLYTSFGCPFRCSFCNVNAMWDKPGIRYRDVDDVLKEIGYLAAAEHVRHLKIADEIFVLDRNRVAKICDGLIHMAGNEPLLNMWAYTRVDTVQPQLLQKMKRAGFNWLVYGFESGCEKVRRGVGKGYTDETVKDAIQMTRDAGISIMANYIFGLPDDDLDSMQQTLDHAIENNFEFVNLYSAMAYPGSQLWKDSRTHYKGVELQWDEDWAAYAQLGAKTHPLDTKHVSGQQVLEFRDKAFRTYFDRPEYKGMIEGKFGTLARAQIDYMLGHNPRRQGQ